MKATMLGHDLLLAGSADIVITGGMESMSSAPYLLQKARGGYRVGHDRIFDHMALDGLEDAYDKGRAMGEFGEATAQRFGFDRAAQAAYAIETLSRAKAAIAGGAFAARRGRAVHRRRRSHGDRDSSRAHVNCRVRAGSDAAHPVTGLHAPPLTAGSCHRPQ